MVLINPPKKQNDYFLLMQHRTSEEMLTGLGIPLFLAYGDKQLAVNQITSMRPQATIEVSHNGIRSFYKVTDKLNPLIPITLWFSVFQISLQNANNIEQTH